MKVCIVGFKGSGKTTVFNAITGLNAAVGGFGGELHEASTSSQGIRGMVWRMADLPRSQDKIWASGVLGSLPVASSVSASSSRQAVWLR